MKAGLLLALAFACLALVACDNGGNGDGDAVTPSDDTAGATVTAGPLDGTATPEGAPAETATPEPEVCLGAATATPEFQIIDQPRAGDTVTSPVTISGQVLAFEGTYQIGIFNAAGEPIVETFGTAIGTEIGQLAPFSIDVAFSVSVPKPACIWVYEASAMDGSPIHVGQIPVTLSP